MKLFELSTDSTSDLYKQELTDWNIYRAPLTFVVSDGKTQTENQDNFEEFSQYEDFYAQLKQGKTSKTSMLNEMAHFEHFEKIVEAGAKNILHISLSQTLSPTFDKAVEAATRIMETYKGVTVTCVQSNSGSVGQAVLVRIAKQMRDEGKSAEETANYLNEIKYKLKIYLMVDSLQHLKRGGRITGAQAAIGAVLSVKPILSFTSEGKLEVVSKVNGTKKAIKTIAEMINKDKVNEKHKEVYLMHTGNTSQPNMLAQELEKVSGIKPVQRYIGPVIGSHIGPGGMGFGYISE